MRDAAILCGLIVMYLVGVISGALVGEVESEAPPPAQSQLVGFITIIYVTETQERTVTRYDGAYQTYEVTSYTAGPESTGKAPTDPLYGITASGLPVEAGTTAACPPSLPFGTRVYVPALENVYVCEDRGSAITEGHLDLYTPGLDDALTFGRRELDVLILPPMSGKESIECSEGNG